MRPVGTPIYAVADGKITYSEYGHTVNTGAHETAYSVKILLDNPFTYGGVTYISAYYTHMQSNLVYNVACNQHGGNKSNTISVKKGDLLGYSGTANYAPHLHFAFEGNAASNYKMSGTTGTLAILGLSYNQKLNGDFGVIPPVTLGITSAQSNMTSGTTNDKFNFSAVTTGASRVELQFNGNNTIYRMNSSDNTNWYLNGNSLNAGYRTITITAYDSNGRSASRTLNVTVTIPTQPSQKTYTIQSSFGGNVRQSASTSAQVIGAVAKGSVIRYTQTVVANGYTWMLIESGSSFASGTWGKNVGYWVAMV